MGNCCFCCVSHEERIRRVLAKFPPLRTAQIQPNMANQIVKIVGRAVLAGPQACYTPTANKPCVFYNLRVEQETIKVEHYQDAEGHHRTRRVKRWTHLLTDEKYVDFYIQDGNTKVFVSAAGGGCRFSGKGEKGGSRSFHNFSVPPPGVQWLISQRCHNFGGWTSNGHRTGRFRYTERAFDVNELIMGLGVIHNNYTDPYGWNGLRLNPLRKDFITPEYMQQNAWTSYDKQSWISLLDKGDAVILSDSTETPDIPQVPPIMGLPVHMTSYVSGMSLWANQQPMMQQPMMQQPMMQQPMMQQKSMMMQQPMIHPTASATIYPAP